MLEYPGMKKSASEGVFSSFFEELEKIAVSERLLGKVFQARKARISNMRNAARDLERTGGDLLAAADIRGAANALEQRSSRQQSAMLNELSRRARSIMKNTRYNADSILNTAETSKAVSSLKKKAPFPKLPEGVPTGRPLSRNINLDFTGKASLTRFDRGGRNAR